MNSRILFAVACLGLANALKLYDDNMPPMGMNMPDDMGGDVAGDADIAIDDSGAYWTGETGVFTADDGTTFVSAAEEEDDNTLVRTDDGKVEEQTYSWDPTLG